MTNSRAGVSTQQYLLTSSFTTSSTTFVIVTAMTLTLKINTGKTLVIATFRPDNDTASSAIKSALHDDASQLEGSIENVQLTANFGTGLTLTKLVNNDGSAIALYIKASANTARVAYSDTNTEPKLEFVEFR